MVALVVVSRGLHCSALIAYPPSGLSFMGMYLCLRGCILSHSDRDSLSRIDEKDMRRLWTPWWGL